MIFEIINLSFSEQGKNYYVAPHVHNNPQWFYVDSGSIEFTIGGKQYILQANDSILIPPGVERSPKCHKKGPHYICTIFGCGDVEISTLYKKITTVPPALLPDIQCLIEEIKSPQLINTRIYLQVLLARTLIGLERHSREDRKESHSTLNIGDTNLMAKRLYSFMRANLHKPLTREDMAEIVNLSVSQMSRKFRSATGKTPGDALTGLRMEQAKTYLQESTLPITQIAYEVGFNSFSHFTQTFKRLVGHSPSDFRRKTAISYSAPNKQ